MSAEKWWQKTVIYQIYPRSFRDSNADGIGDIQGMISQLDYLKDLGIETIWSSPFYSSPHKDHGYDIIDYYAIDSDYGRMEDAQQLIEEVHQRDMKILFDMVLNHTSIEHPWFQESRASKTSPKRDWYIWQPGKDEKKPPNNWKSMIGTDGWQYDESTDEWFYCNFLPFQPDLNFNNPEVKEEMFRVIRFWLDKGVDGFRLDIFNSIYKDETFQDNPFSFRMMPSMDNNDEGYFQKKVYNFNHPKNFILAKEIRSLVDEYSPDRLLLGEVSGNLKVIKKFFGENHDGLHLIFMFETLHMKFHKKFFQKILSNFEKEFPEPYVPTYVFSNHDIIRSISQLDDDLEKARCLALFQLTVRGVPVIYYGEEIGMTDPGLTFDKSQDPIVAYYRYIPKPVFDVLGVFLNRDRCRTPMQWNGEKNAGFSATNQNTWLPITNNFPIRNVNRQQERPGSLWHVYKTLLHLRQKEPAIRSGRLIIVKNKSLAENVLFFKRENEDTSYWILINLSEKPAHFFYPFQGKEIVLKLKEDFELTDEQIFLPPVSGCILK